MRLIILCVLLVLIPSFAWSQFIGLSLSLRSNNQAASISGGGGGSINHGMLFNGKQMLFNGSSMTFTHS